MLAHAAAGADSILIQSATSSCCGETLHITANRGASWSTVELAGFQIGLPLGAAPDGSFRIVAAHIGGPTLQELQVFRLATGGAAEPLGSIVAEDDGLFGDQFAIDDAGAVWIPYRDDSEGRFELAIVAADGSSERMPLPDVGAERWAARRTAFGIRLVASGGAGSVSGLPRRGTFRLDTGGDIVPAEAYPVEFAEGGFWFSPATERASWDGGAHWSEVFEGDGIVPRIPGPPRFLDTESGLAARYSSSLYRGTGPESPGGPALFAAVDTGEALVARSQDAVYVQSLPLPSPPSEIGQLGDDARAMIARANLFRADAGLPPLIGDAGISRAARNHSAYTVAHPDELGGLSAHRETPGKSGYTGRTPSERCEAVGASCGSEVMYAPVPDPVGGWLATVFHRFLPGSPEAGLVGAGHVDGGWFVMNGGADSNVLLQPFGYPVGRWRGEAGFSGEIPDPVDPCRASGQPIEYPLGIAVTLFLPERIGTLGKIEVRRHGEAQALAGCLLTDSRSFILDDPLDRGAIYDVAATWNPGPEPLPGGGWIPGPELSYGWSFRFEPDPIRSPIRRPLCRVLGLRTIKSVAPARRGRSHKVLGIEEKVVLKQKARVRLRRARLNYWVAGDRHSLRLKLGRLRRKSVVVGKTSYLRFRLPRTVARRVMPGEEAELRLAFTGRRARGCRRVVHVSRVRKIELGWVRVKGPAAWVSGRARGRR